MTNSFHGIAISLLFEKQFYVYENGGVMTRIDGLLSQMGLLGRKVKMSTDIDQTDIIDYSRINAQLEELRNDSMQFLMKAIEGKITEKKHARVNGSNAVLPMNKKREKGLQRMLCMCRRMSGKCN